MRDLKSIRVLLTIIAVPIVVLMLKTLKTIFIPLIFAVFLSFLFAPLITAMRRKKIPTAVTISTMLIIIVLFFALVGGGIFAAVNTFIAEFPRYQLILGQMLQDTTESLSTWAQASDLIIADLPLYDISELINSSGFSLPKLLSGTMGTFIDYSVTMFLTMIFLMFLVTGTGKMEARIKRFFNEEDKVKSIATMMSIQTQIQKYFFNKTLISLGTALTGMLFLFIFGVDFILMAGMLLFILNFIPNIGSIIASLLPMLISLVQYGFGWRTIAVASCLIFTQIVFANILEPRLMGQKLNLTPIMVLISLIFWGWVWGITGMMLAVPITSAINIILKHFDDKNLISAIISDT